MVPGPGPACRFGRLFGGPRLHGDQALRLRHLGKNAGCPGRHVQSNRAPKRLLSPLYTQIIL